MKKTLRISFNGKSYDVEAEILGEDLAPIRDSAPRRSAAAIVAPVAPVVAAPKAAAGGPAGAGDVPSPLAGKVVSIDAPVGTAVTAGQAIMTLEAMKMNTVVSAPTAGTIASVAVHPGDSVEEGQSLMTIN